MKKRIRLTEGELRDIVRESVINILNEVEMNGSEMRQFSDENGIDVNWLRSNGGFLDDDYRNPNGFHASRMIGLMDDVENAVMNDPQIIKYFKEPSNDLLELKRLLGDKMYDMIIPENSSNTEDLEAFNMINNENVFNRWVTDVMWKMFERYRGMKRPSLKDGMSDVRKALNDLNMGDDKSKETLRNHFLFNDPYAQGKLKGADSDLSGIRRYYGDMTGV